MRLLLGKAVCPASCGEIVQGTIDDCNFLVTCPIALCTQVTVRLDGNTNKSLECSELKHFKTNQAVEKTLKYFGVEDLKAHVSINSNIPYAVGLSSSTADITAACLATAKALGKNISNDVIADIALSIEPSDGIMYPGVMLFDHIHGIWRKSLGQMPEMDVYIIDTGEQVDTKQFNNMKDLKQKNRKKEPEVKQALDLVLRAFGKGDVKLLGDAMKKSAAAHQSILFKPHLSDVIELGNQYSAVGVNVAHSGSVVGIFFKKRHIVSQSFWNKIRDIMLKYDLKYHIIKTHTDNNGPRIVQNYPSTKQVL
ncbi:MAG: GHMP kinase [Tepidanaerobacteraceae bacterium]|jgi:L-threonine kinase